MKFINIDTTLNDNFKEVSEWLQSNNYLKLGHIKPAPCGFCVLIKPPKQFFECSDFSNKNIDIVFSVQEFKNKLDEL